MGSEEKAKNEKWLQKYLAKKQKEDQAKKASANSETKLPSKSILKKDPTAETKPVSTKWETTYSGKEPGTQTASVGNKALDYKLVWIQVDSAGYNGGNLAKISINDKLLQV